MTKKEQKQTEERQKLPDNYVAVSGKTEEVEIRIGKGKTRVKRQFTTSDERYLMSISSLLREHKEVIVTGRGASASGRCVKLATHKQIEDLIQPIKDVKVEIGVEEFEREDRKNPEEKYMARVEFIKITLKRKG